MLGEIKIKYFNRGIDPYIGFDAMNNVVIKFPNFVAIPMYKSQFTCDDCELNIHEGCDGFLDTSKFRELSPRCEHTYTICECADNMIIKPFTELSLFIMSYIVHNKKILYIVRA